MDRDAVAASLRCVYAFAVPLCRAARNAAAVPSNDAAETALAQSRARSAEKLIEYLEILAHEVLGPSFRFEPDMARTTDVTPARQSALRPSARAEAQKPSLVVVRGGAPERPSDRFIDSADDAPKAG